MHYRSYKDHFIVASAARHEQTGKHYPVICITWNRSDGAPGIQIIDGTTQQFASFDEARTRAVELAESWIDRKLG